MERASRLLVLTSAFTGLAVQTWLGQREWVTLWPLTLGVALGFFVIARRSQSWAFGVALGVAFVFPVLFQATLGRFLPAYHVVWFAAMLGAIAGAPGSWSAWALPVRWRVRLALWAMLVAVAWPLVVAREADFTWAWLTRVHHMSNSGIGGPPPVVSVWIINVALTVLTGLLWFDRLFTYADRPDRCLRSVVLPLAAGMALSCTLAVYQGLVDVSFLNDHQWPGINRAGGGLIDGDAFGAAAGFWTAAALALVCSGGRQSAILGGSAAVLAWAGVWASGSRMALAAALLGTGVAIVYAVRAAVVARQYWRLVPGGAVVVAVAGLAAFSSWTTANPLHRAYDSLPALDRPSLKQFVRFELFDRGAPYGTASVMMFTESPLAGVGVGSFNGLFPDYSFRIEKTRRNFDNAQSWYRQQLAEGGILGAVGWLLWLPSVAWLLVRTRGTPHTSATAGALKGALLAIAIVTAVSLPTQETFVAMLPWALLFWYLQASPTGRSMLDIPPRMRPRMAWSAAWIWALVFASVTFAVGWTQLRPPLRAIRAEWPYTAGFHDLETPADARPFWWIEGRAVQVFPMQGKYLKLTVRGGPPDVATNPIRLSVWRTREHLFEVTRANRDPQTWYIAARPDDFQQMMLEFHVSRTWRPASSDGGTDERDLALQVEQWAWVDDLPEGAAVFATPTPAR